MARKKAPAIPALSFDHFLTCDEVTAFVQKLAAARPERCRLSFRTTIARPSAGDGEGCGPRSQVAPRFALSWPLLLRRSWTANYRVMT